MLIIIQYNEYNKRVTGSFKRISFFINPDKERYIIKVNNLIFKEKELLRSQRGINPRIVINDIEFSIAI